MLRRQAYKFRIEPTGEQQRKLRQFAGACRFVFNKALAVQQVNREEGGKYIGYVAMAKYLTAWRNGDETPWLKDAPVHPLQHALKDLDRAYQNFFAQRADFPRFKKRGQRDSFRYPDPKQIKLDQGNSRINLPKLGWLRYRNSRQVLGTLKNVTVSLSAGHWYVSIQTEREVAVPLHAAPLAVGIDLGVVRFATLWDGERETVLEPLNTFARHQHRLAKAQRQMARKTKFSSNWKKAKARVQRIQRQIANARADYLHKATTAISKSHALVIVEDLQVASMTRSASGTAEQPGSRVRQKAGLNRSILDQGWGEFRRQLDYKLAWRGGWLVAVPPQNTSRTCPCCGHVSADNRQTQARFECVGCGYENNADVVGAINILRAGHARLAESANAE
ncbi:RNA-guided endonuclease InsQ/TnpB family protein [Pseudomonas rhodesiae]|uniref:Transposase, IS605 OrfB family, central region n=1 Tax=Pseudomonas rhodesiae TaxID=76760 RepID=A0AAE8HJ90_9PSED|nr:RNA-guided endonuclease TnpB family protein [Pseudomonas rhodesiae]TWR50724.1 IS200/IS605 family element transposase accessory protein TnpB [Pseudomonas rhodesiae]SDV17432.1 transposase, IS605 OrfB family, central region [Pseudomonas rhodesiae]